MAVVGIDLGTTNTVVATVNDGQAAPICDETGTPLVPSVVSFHPNGNVLVGAPARERRAIDPSNTIYSIKRLVGRSWGSPEVTEARARFPFELRQGPGQAPLVVARGESFTLPEISAFVLRHVKASAERALGTDVSHAVITVPANFNDLQRAATKVAGRVAGLEVLRILNEPTAAALAYGYGRGHSERVAIYDFGGGTFDVTILDLSGNVFEVLATAGNTFLGGEDIDLAIAERLSDQCLAAHRFDPRAHRESFERICVAAEQAKIALSSRPTCHVHVPELAHGPGGKPVSLDLTLDLAELTNLARPIVERTFSVCEEALSTAGLGTADLDQVVLVGGTTRMRLVRERVTTFFGRAPLDRINPDEVVAIGAAIQAAALATSERRRSIIPTPPHPAGARSARPATEPGGRAGGAPPLPRHRAASAGSEPPAALVAAPVAVAPPIAKAPSKDLGDTQLSEGFQPVAPKTRSVHADEPSARHAPGQDLPLLIDVTPQSLAVETVRGYCDVVVPRNSPIPCSETRAFVTAVDGQTAVHIRICQGEEPLFGANTPLGVIELSGLLPAPRGKTEIVVAFAVDANGMLSISAQNAESGRQAQARLALIGMPDAKAIEAMTQKHEARAQKAR
jgi:molecular chaperone DnaK